MPPKKKASATTNPPQPPPPSPAPLIAPWTAVPDSTGNIIPYLQQTIVEKVSVHQNGTSESKTKNVRYLLVTHSDGSRKIDDHSGFDENQICAPSDDKYLGLIRQLGETLANATNLNISSGGNKPGDDTWDVLVQLPMGYTAYYKERKTGDHADLYIAGHDRKNFDSVKQFGKHLAWLAKQDGGGCECRICRNERGEGGSVRQQAARKRRWAENQGPVLDGVPGWNK